MKEPNKARCSMWSEAFYGSATVGERGQLVIPAEARSDLEISPGDKLLIMHHPIYKGLMLFKIEAIREFLDDFQSNLDKFEENKEEGA